MVTNDHQIPIGGRGHEFTNSGHHNYFLGQSGPKLGNSFSPESATCDRILGPYYPDYLASRRQVRSVGNIGRLGPRIGFLDIGLNTRVVRNHQVSMARHDLFRILEIGLNRFGPLGPLPLQSIWIDIELPTHLMNLTRKGCHKRPQ